MIAKFPGKCWVCGAAFPKGSEVDFDRSSRKIRHEKCRAVDAAGPDYREPEGEPNAEQKIILEAVETQLLQGQNLLVQAYAGTGKTWLLQKAVYLLQHNKALYLTFSKELADEAQSKFDPDLCRASTFHSLGYKLWKQEYPASKVNTDKMTGIVERFDFTVPTEDGKRRNLSREVKEVVNWVRENLVTVAEAIEAKGFVEWPEHFEAQVEAVLEAGERETHHFDFADMLYLPVKYGLRLRRDFKVLLVDEIQDLSPVMLAFLQECIGKEGLKCLFVGDRNQCIYEWRGASEHTVDFLADEYSCVSLVQPETFRCPSNHVELVRRTGLVPDYRGRKEPGPLYQGPIEGAEKWINTTHTVIARRNAQLALMAMKLLRQGKKAVLKDKNFADSISAYVKKLQIGDNQQIGELLTACRAAVREEIEKLKLKFGESARMADKLAEMVEMKSDLLEVFEVLGEGIGLSEFVWAFKAHVETLFDSRAKGIELFTIHGSKGKTFEETVILDYPKMVAATGRENQRLLYVAQTRASKGLVMLYGKEGPVELPVPELK